MGQGSELTVDVRLGPVGTSTIREMLENFHARHNDAYGYAYKDKQLVELVNLRVTCYGTLPKYTLSRIREGGQDGSPAVTGTRQIYFKDSGGFVESKIYDRTKLFARNSIKGPSVVEQYDSTIVIPPRMQARVDEFGNLVMKTILE